MSNGIEIGVIGDFSGRDGGPDLAVRLAEKVLVTLDLDELDACVRRIRPEIELGLPFARTVRIDRFDDFDPETLVRTLSLDEAPLEDEGRAGGRAPAPAAPATIGEASGRDVLDELLVPRHAGRSSAPPDPAGRAIQEIVERSGDGVDHVAADRRRSQLQTLVAERLRRVLHHPRWQAVESRWRALHALGREALAVDGARIRFVDLGAADLVADLERAGGRFEDTSACRLLVEQERGTPGGIHFDLLIGDVELADEERAEPLAALLADLAARAGCPLVASAGPSLSGVTSEGVDPPRRERLALLAKHATRGRLGLVAPRVLARAPYAAGDFGGLPVEELESGAAQPLLWGSGAWIIARAALAAVDAGLPPSALGRFARVDGLASAVVRRSDVAEQLGPAERTLSERELAALAAAGLVPLAGIRGSEAVQLVALRALDGAPLFSRS